VAGFAAKSSEFRTPFRLRAGVINAVLQTARAILAFLAYNSRRLAGQKGRKAVGRLRLVVDILVEYFDSIAGLVENCLEPIGFTSGIFMPILLSEWPPRYFSFALPLGFHARGA